ncbi:cytochrome C oxidase subunit IV family protein [Rhodoferax ferrireducens]|uniref:cytochrome C oxidase subunit IV family protein n=1 Tax=Rhodoferax ferrireducens TaxID=192843 RepID=UPI000E0E0720|nr:cytochrome C oxidase subunit IV family protein [Rhodoferax ferrireducens]
MSNRETFIAKFDPLTLAWGILVAATGIGWWFGHTAQIGNDGARLSMAGVFVTAFFKAWVVGFQFMELKRAPRWLRHTYDLWIVGVCAALMFICLR